MHIRGSCRLGRPLGLASGLHRDRWYSIRSLWHLSARSWELAYPVIVRRQTVECRPGRTLRTLLLGGSRALWDWASCVACRLHIHELDGQGGLQCLTRCAVNAQKLGQIGCVPQDRGRVQDSVASVLRVNSTYAGPVAQRRAGHTI